jgi:hypothetical protein
MEKHEQIQNLQEASIVPEVQIEEEKVLKRTAMYNVVDDSNWISRLTSDYFFPPDVFQDAARLALLFVGFLLPPFFFPPNLRPLWPCFALAR